MIESYKKFQNVLQTRVYLKYPIAVAKAQAGCGLLSYSDFTKKWAANHNVDNLMGFTILYISRLKLIAIVAITFMKNYLIQIQIVIIVIK